ncbi:hypothetical protein CTT39_17345 [Agrobacterium rosae]|nr:hypothetical protein CTT39_17345 [Agrobacterium rosae]
MSNASLFRVVPCYFDQRDRRLNAKSAALIPNFDMLLVGTRSAMISQVLTVRGDPPYIKPVS